MKKLRMFLLCVFALSAQANISEDLSHFSDGLGSYSNITNAQAFHGQQAGYYTGGSVFMRIPVKNFQLVDISLPSARGGCSGIDFQAGGFSFINSSQFVEMGRRILNNAQGYGFMLALETVTPEIANVMKSLQDYANKLNQMNINSCETTQALMGAALPRVKGAQQQLCQDLGASSGVLADYAKARQECSQEGGDYDHVMNGAREDPKYKNMVLDRGNIVWHALQNNGLVSNDVELAELLMSLSGSIIIRAEDGTNHFSVLSSLVQDHELLDALLNGGNAKIYVCDEKEECLRPSIKDVHIKPENALRSKVSALISSISTKVVEDTPLNSQEIGFIQAVSVPILKIIDVQAAYQKNSNILDLDSYADVIASGLLFKYLQENLSIVERSSHTLQYPVDIMSDFTRQINKALSDVRAEEQTTNQKLNMLMQLVSASQNLEKMLAGELSTELGNSLTWARTLR